MSGNDGSTNRFDKFTERARKVLTLAQEEATRLNHNYIGTEHLLLGLVRESEGVAAKVLANLGVELNQVRAAVEHIIGRGDRMQVGEIGLTPRAKKVIELAVDEARRLGHHYIGTEHLLLGLVREGEGVAAGVLESLGVNLEKVRSQTIQVLAQSGSSHSLAQSGSSHSFSASPSASRGATAPGGGHPRWEYLTVRFTCPDADGDDVVARIDGRADGPPLGDAPRPLHEALRAFGAGGWELVGIDTAGERASHGARYVFKRPLQSTPLESGRNGENTENAR